MTKKTRKVLLWLARFIIVCILFMIVRMALDWIIDATPFASLNAYGFISIIITVAIIGLFDTYAERHGLK